MGWISRLVLGAAAQGLVIGVAGAQEVEVTVSGIPAAEGKLMMSLCDEDGYATWEGCAFAEPAATGDTVTYAFVDVAPGTYAISVYHDQNANGRIDFSDFGPPSEAYGSSNNPLPRMGPPLWDDIKFEVNAESDTTVAITLIRP